MKPFCQLWIAFFLATHLAFILHGTAKSKCALELERVLVEGIVEGSPFLSKHFSHLTAVECAELEGIIACRYLSLEKGATSAVKWDPKRAADAILSHIHRPLQGVEQATVWNAYQTFLDTQYERVFSKVSGAHRFTVHRIFAVARDIQSVLQQREAALRRRLFTNLPAYARETILRTQMLWQPTEAHLRALLQDRSDKWSYRAHFKPAIYVFGSFPMGRAFRSNSDIDVAPNDREFYTVVGILRNTPLPVDAPLVLPVNSLGPFYVYFDGTRFQPRLPGDIGTISPLILEIDSDSINLLVAQLESPAGTYRRFVLSPSTL